MPPSARKGEPMKQARITHRGETTVTDMEGWQATMDDMVERLGPWDVATSKVEIIETVDQPQYSSWGAGKQIVDEAARDRIQAQRDVLAAAGMGVDEKVQLYSTG